MCDSKYIITSEAEKDANWLNNFIDDLGGVTSIKDPMEMFYDNECVQLY